MCVCVCVRWCVDKCVCSVCVCRVVQWCCIDDWHPAAEVVLMRGKSLSRGGCNY